MTGAPGGEDRLDKMGLVALHQGNYDLAESLFGRDLERLAPKSPARGGRTGFLGDVEVARGNLDRTLPYFEEGASGSSQERFGLAVGREQAVYLLRDFRVRGGRDVQALLAVGGAQRARRLECQPSRVPIARLSSFHPSGLPSRFRHPVGTIEYYKRSYGSRIARDGRLVEERPGVEAWSAALRGRLQPA